VRLRNEFVKDFRDLLGHIQYDTMDGERVSFDKLEGASNWLTWKFQMRQVLEASELFDIVDGTVRTPMDPYDSGYAAELAAWKKGDAKARRAISTACKTQPLLQIMNCKTAASMWSTLRSTYEQSSKSNIVFLQQRYYSFAKEPGDDIATFLSKLTEVVQQLKDQNESISDSMVMTKILMSLPAEYNHFHSAWESTRVEDQTMTNLRARLMAEELRLKAQGQIESVEALAAKRNFPRRNFSKRGHSSKENGGKNDKGGKPKGKCFACGKTGHWKRDCPLGKADASSVKKEGNASGDAFVCSASGDDRDVWILDSGASDHMSHRREWFENFTEASSSITVGNGSKIMAEGTGDINILAFNGAEWIRKHIANVLYVPGIHMNLFSSGKVMDRGHRLQSNKEHCEILKDDNIVAVGVRQNGLFQMLFKVIQPTGVDVAVVNMAVKRVSLRSWHERLGHQNIAHVRKFLRSNGIDFVDEDFACEACVYGKHHRGSFKLRLEKSKECGKIIHADVCGPMQTESMGGSRYFLLIKDDYSHFRFVYFLKHKSEVAAKVKNAVMRMQQEGGHKVQIFRSDNGTEFVNADLKKFFDGKGIQHQRTVPYTPEQNGCAERENRTIVEAARTMLHSKKMNYKFWAEAVNMAVHVLNRSGTSTVPEKSPYELWHNKKAKIDHLRIFGSEVFVHIPKEKRQKLDAKAVKCVFVGYDNDSKGYCVWNPVTNRIEIACNVIFLLEESSVTIGINNDEDEVDENAGDSEIESNADVNTEMNSEETPEKSIQCGVLCDLNKKNIVEKQARSQKFGLGGAQNLVINFLREGRGRWDESGLGCLVWIFFIKVLGW
jgi:hypothetical protein